MQDAEFEKLVGDVLGSLPEEFAKKLIGVADRDSVR
jgi:hypothetical protein